MKSPRAARRHQAGITLIGMMVGLVISLLTISAMLAIYKTSIDISVNASRSALRDGQMSAALLAAQIELQQAGYGIAPGEAGVLSVSPDGQQVLWRYSAYPQAGSRCAGLKLVTAPNDASIAVTPADAQSDRRGLYLLPGKACTSVDPAPSWGSDASERPRPLVSAAGFFVPTDKQGTALTDEAGGASLTGLRFQQVAGGGCLPYAQQADTEELPEQSQRIVLLAGSGEQLFSVCLPNVQTVVAATEGE